MPASTTTELRRRSIEIIRDGQAASGAYVACPTFPVYGYAWLRDGSFVADAMSRAGEVESAEAFHDWAARVVLDRDGRGLATRYTLDGRDDETAWPSRQWDGWGLWLWAVAGHCERHGVPRARWGDAVELVTDFLDGAWHRPCTDWWEERDGLHATTLGCIVAGLGAWHLPTDHVRDALEREADWRLDASLLALTEPLGLIEADRVLPRVRDALVSPGGGVHRHLNDRYYGGGEWLLLTAMLGLVEGGDGAHRALDWIEAHAGPGGELPEQSQEHLLAPDRYDEWVAKWGRPPSPLLWSHAMYLDLAFAVDAS